MFQTDGAWWRYYSQRADTIRPVVVENVIKVLACGLEIMGYAAHSCTNPHCPHTKKVCFSCKSRFCPTCGKKATDQWIRKQQQTLPDTDWQHITFTMPSALWQLFKLNRFLLKQLSRLAAKIIKKRAREKGVLPGIFIALHTFGRDLKWNTHVHVSVTCGGLTLDKSQWKSLYFVKAQIMPLWRYEIVTLLRQSYDALVLPDALKADCATKQQWNAWLDGHYRKPWIVHFAPPSASHHRTVNYLGRYLKRPPLSQSRLKHYDGKTVAFDYLDHNSGSRLTARFDTDEFIDRFVQHIPDKHFRMINFYGFLANRVRSVLLPQIYAILNQSVATVRAIGWRALQKLAFGTDPLLCILCGSQMRLAAIVTKKSARSLLQYHQALALAKIVP